MGLLVAGARATGTTGRQSRWCHLLLRYLFLLFVSVLAFCIPWRSSKLEIRCSCWNWGSSGRICAIIHLYGRLIDLHLIASQLHPAWSLGEWGTGTGRCHTRNDPHSSTSCCDETQPRFWALHQQQNHSDRCICCLSIQWCASWSRNLSRTMAVWPRQKRSRQCVVCIRRMG